MNDQDLEQQIRNLRPGPLPPELRSRLREEPPIEFARPRRHLARWAMAAAVVAAAVIGAFVFPPNPPNEVVAGDEEYFSVVKQEAILLDTRTLEMREHDGQLWELVEV